jgi:hypothetical protein
MKKISVLLALMALFFCDLVLAASAVVTSATGTVQVQTGSGPARTLRQGDEVAQGDTVSTGVSGSSVVLKFDDGQVAALTANSRMTITAYQYNPATESGNVLLSLVTGGMRAITGLIGRRSPNQVSFRAASATIGIRGSDGTIVTMNDHLIVTVKEGAFSITWNNQTFVIPAGEGIHLRPDGTFSRGAIGQIQRELQSTALGRQILDSLGGIDGLTNAINQAFPGTPRQGGGLGPPGGVPPGPSIDTPGNGPPPGGGGGGGGGPPSKS